MKPEIFKMQAIKMHLLLASKWQVRSFLGMEVYYRKFIPHFATLAAPLTDLTRKKSSHKINMTPWRVLAFQGLKSVPRDQTVFISLEFQGP